MCGGVYLSDLLLHAFDFILPWLHLSAQLLDLVVQYKLELLQLLVLLLQVINTLLLHRERETEEGSVWCFSQPSTTTPTPTSSTHTRGRGHWCLSSPPTHTHTYLILNGVIPLLDLLFEPLNVGLERFNNSISLAHLLS